MIHIIIYNIDFDFSIPFLFISVCSDLCPGVRQSLDNV